jgi:hypothetical protein
MDHDALCFCVDCLSPAAWPSDGPPPEAATTRPARLKRRAGLARRANERRGDQQSNPQHQKPERQP